MKIFLIVLFILVVLVLIAYYCILRKFVNMAIERDCSFFSGRFGDGTPYEQEINEGTAWLNAKPQEQVEITAEDGLRLRGHYITVPGATRTVLACHGWRGSWDYDFALGGRWFIENGCNVLFIEQRAQGNSEGKYMTLGLLESRDCRRWVAWLNENRKSDLPVYLCGISMGASTVLMATGEKLPDNVVGVIADCGYTTPYDMLYSYGHRRFKVKEKPVMHNLDFLCRKRIGMGLREYSTLDAMKTCSLPVLFIHGTADTFVPYEMSRKNFDACVSEKKLLLIEGADHGASFMTDRQKYTTEVLEMFKKLDSRVPNKKF